MPRTRRLSNGGEKTAYHAWDVEPIPPAILLCNHIKLNNCYQILPPAHCCSTVLMFRTALDGFPFGDVGKGSLEPRSLSQ